MRKSISILLFCIAPWLLASAHASNVLNQGFVPAPSTHLIEVRQGLYLSNLASSLGRSGFETAGGSWVDFQHWYRPRWVDTRVSWLTQVNPNLGLVWGLSTGERADKYSIQPGLRLGFLAQIQPSKQSVMALSYTTVLGGRMQEKTCLADYGDIGGQQVVNCRLAATTLEPSETLKFLINEKPSAVVQLGFSRTFN